MTVRVKICGVRDAATMRACMAAGVEFVGLNFAPGSRRAIDVEEAIALRALAVDHPVRFVGVFRDAPIQLVLRIGERVGLDYVQLHGRETPEDCLRASEHVPVIKALVASEALLKAPVYQSVAAHLLIDGRRPGSGEVWDYASVAGVTDVFLAGGLHVDNVASAIRSVRPFAVDTASGVERGGVPDPALVEQFVAAARGAMHQSAEGAQA